MNAGGGDLLTGVLGDPVSDEVLLLLILVRALPEVAVVSIHDLDEVVLDLAFASFAAVMLTIFAGVVEELPAIPALGGLRLSGCSSFLLGRC